MSNDEIHDYATNLNIADENFEKLCQNMRDGKVVINSSDDAMAAYNTTVKQTHRATILADAGTKALTVSMKILSSIGWMLVITAITELIGKLISSVEEAIVTTNEARELSTELTQAYKEESDSLNDLISRYQELSSSLDDANLLESEQLSIKQDLSAIQDTLNEKYKDEVKDIDLVTGKYEEQLATLKMLSKEKARDYVRKNEDNIEKEKDYLYDNVNSKSGWAGNENYVIAPGSTTAKYASGFDMFQFINYLSGNRIYGDTGNYDVASVNEAMGFDIESILKKYNNVGLSYNLDASSYALSYNGKLVEVYDELYNLYNELLDYQEEHGNVGYLEQIIFQIENRLNSTQFDEEKINQSRQNIQDYAQAEILANGKTNDLYYKASEAVAQYNEALTSGEGVDEAKKNLDAVQKEVKNAYGKGGILKDINGAEYVFNVLWDEISSGSKDASKSLTESVDKITVSLDAYKQASEGVSSLSTAYKELSDNEYISLETISKIKEAVGNSISNWSEYEQKLLSVKKGTEEYNQIMGELTYATLENQLGGVNKLANASEEYVTRLLEENGVLNANEVAIEAIKRAKAKNIAQSTAFQDKTAEEIVALKEQFIQCGYTEGAFWDLIAQEQIFNSTTLDVTGKIDALKHLMMQAGITSEVIAGLTGATSGLDKINDAITLGVTTDKNGDITFNGNVYGKGQEALDKAMADATLYAMTNEYQKKLEEKYKDIFVEYKDIFTDLSSEKSKSPFDWIEIAISRAQRAIKNFGDTVSNTWESWTTRNDALSQQLSAITDEIKIQEEAKKKYEQLANNVTGLSSEEKRMVREGAIKYDEKYPKADTIKKYQEYYEKALEAEDRLKELEGERNETIRTSFDNISQEFDDKIGDIENNIGIIEAMIDQVEMKGNLVGKSYYSSMLKEEEENLSLLQNKYQELSNKLNDGSIRQGTQEWYDMLSEIKNVKKEIIESTTALEEYQKTMRELDWEKFDLIQDKIGNVTEESEFLIDLLSNSKLFNDDGSITEQGQATLGLHVANMRVYESQVKDYADEIAKLDKQFADDSLDPNYIKRREELVETQRDMILAAQEEKNSIKDLMSQGYDNLLSYMDELISKRKELLSQASDARSFQKTVQEQTDEISRLQNIINSYSGDLSEESKSALQKYQVELKEAESNLEETLLDKQLEEEQKMLDMLADESEQFVSEILDNTNGLIQKVVESADANAETIKTTLEQEISGVGGTLTTEMENILSGEDGVNNTLIDIKEIISKMVDEGGDDESYKDVGGSNEKPPTTPNDSNSDNTNKPTNTPTTTNTSVVTVGSKIDANGALIYRQANGKNGQKQYYDENPYYIVLDEKNGFVKVRHQSLSSGTTGWFKKSDVKAYRTGGLVDKTGLAWLDGTKSKPELVLNPHQTENYMKLTKALDTVARTNMFDAIQNYAKLPNFVSGATNNNQQAMIIQGDIVLPNVHNREDLARELKEIYQGDISHVRKTIRADVYGGMLGKNSLTRYKY